MKKLFVIEVIAISVIFIIMCYTNKLFANNNISNMDIENYTIYTTEGKFLFEKDVVSIDDEYLSEDFKKYKVIKIDDILKTGVAKFIEVVELPNVQMSYEPNIVSDISKKIGLYMTHNDESYVPTDKTESVYGRGGIHDVAKCFKSELEKNGITTYIDETLHIPHDSLAYSRSSKTANKLLSSYNLNAIFDIHRDGTSRSYYVSNETGAEFCKIRIVVGKANPNYKINEQFALYLLAVSKEIYPNLFKDIYYASGHYNQGLNEKSLLFEMGSHLVEKELVLKSMKPLASVINMALFNTTVNTSNGDLTINGNETEDEILIDNAMEQMATKNTENNDNNWLYVTVVVVGLMIIFTGIILNYPKNKPTKKHKK